MTAHPKSPLLYDHLRGGTPCPAGGCDQEGGEVFVLDMVTGEDPGSGQG
jgi:hypothetical protein